MSIRKPGYSSEQAIHRARAATVSLKRIAGELWDTLDDLARAVEIIQVCDDAPELALIRQRIARWHEHRREMELAGYTITIDRALDAAWQKLL